MDQRLYGRYGRTNTWTSPSSPGVWLCRRQSTGGLSVCYSWVSGKVLRGTYTYFKFAVFVIVNVQILNGNICGAKLHNLVAVIAIKEIHRFGYNCIVLHFTK
jgi:hypothetical protein